MTRLSVRESEALDFVRRYINRRGHAPFQKEIAEALGLRSRGFILRLLASLEAKGHIEKTPFKVGGISLTGLDPAKPTFITQDVWSIVKSFADAEGVDPKTLIAEWVRERASYEVGAKEGA